MQIGMIDTLEISFDVQSYDDIFKDWLEKLDYSKNLSQTYRNNEENKKAQLTLYNSVYEVMPNGSANHAYILHSDFLEIKFAKARSKNINFYPIFIRAKSAGLWANSPEKICVLMNNTIRSINKNIEMDITDRIKRVDLCCHTDEFKVDNSTLEEFQGRYVSNDIRRSHQEIETFALGSRSNPIYCRIYNKIKEVAKKKSNIWFMDIWQNHGLNDANIWNIEFEIKREFLSSIGINTIYDLFSNIKTLWVYCTTEWLQHKQLINSRIERCPVSNQWKTIQSAFDEYIGKQFITKRKQNELSAQELIPVITGHVTRYASCFEDVDIETALDNIYDLGGKYLNHKNTDFESEINRKRRLRKEAIQ